MVLVLSLELSIFTLFDGFLYFLFENGRTSIYSFFLFLSGVLMSKKSFSMYVIKNDSPSEFFMRCCVLFL